MEKVWIYISDKELKGELAAVVLKTGDQFVNSWTAHQNPLTASFKIAHDRFIVVAVDETNYYASGCSTDKLLRFIKQLESEHNLVLLNRLLVGYKTTSGVEVVHSSAIKQKIEAKQLDENTPVFNIACSNSDEYSKWLQPLKDTWLKKYL
ncbi:MAG: hypothetical protein IPI93_01785 [Sphingobacteriaceae bacterium]|nr:hypothetical protein [Sphingobacteriaceae bacterium]MBK7309536.1 hypothetical protein [Sphingobacteriaceae bacterium]